ncbi:MAG: methyltransferase family protein [Chitinophagales bacterium]
MPLSSIPFLQLSAYAWWILLLFWFYAGMKTKMTIKKQDSKSRLIHLLLVGIAFGLVYSDRMAIGFLASRFLPKNEFIYIAGLCISAAGMVMAVIARQWLGSNWSATVTVKKDHDLIQTGPYAITRHPIYTGMFFGLAGAVIILGETRGLIAIAFFFIAIEIKMSTEEKFMNATFPMYESYARKTRKFIPFLY